MPDTLTGLAHAVEENTSPAVLPSVHRLQALAHRVEVFAAANPGLDPDTHLNLLTKLARTVDPHIERSLTAVRLVLGLDVLSLTDQPWAGPWPDPTSAPTDVAGDPVIAVCDDQAAALAARLPIADTDRAEVRRILARALTDAFIAGHGIDPNGD